MKQRLSKTASFLKHTASLKNKASQIVASAFIAVLTSPAFAASPSSGGSNMPWEGPLDRILSSVQGPVARTFILISIIACGIGMAFGEHGSGFKKVMGIAFGGAIVIGAVSFVSNLFGATF